MGSWGEKRSGGCNILLVLITGVVWVCCWLVGLGRVSMVVVVSGVRCFGTVLGCSRGWRSLVGTRYEGARFCQGSKDLPPYRLTFQSRQYLATLFREIVRGGCEVGVNGRADRVGEPFIDFLGTPR